MHVGTIVTAVSNLILVIVQLTGIKEELAIILKTPEKDIRKSTGHTADGRKAFQYSGDNQPVSPPSVGTFLTSCDFALHTQLACPISVKLSYCKGVISSVFTGSQMDGIVGDWTDRWVRHGKP